MDKKTMWITVLSVTAVALAALNYAARPAQALMTIKDRDFSMVTARTQNQGDCLYIMDNRTGKVAVYTYDSARKVMLPRVFGDIAALFSNNP